MSTASGKMSQPNRTTNAWSNVSKATEESEEARPDDERRLSARGVIKTVTGRGTARGIPELHQVAMEMEDGTVFEAGMPTPEGVEATGRLLPVNVEYLDFGECPICLEPNPSSREHVPPHSIGGNVKMLTCERCNNEFGSRFEPHLQGWYEHSLGRVRIAGGDVPGRRKGGEYIIRVTPEGQPVLFQVGQSDPNFDRMIQSGKIEFTIPVFNDKAFRLAALKSAYLAACLMLKEVPRTERAEAIRAELMAARDRPRDDAFDLTPLAQSIHVSRTAADPEPGEIALVHMTHGDGAATYAIGFNRVFAVDWPLDPFNLVRVETPDTSGPVS
jgi:hypothetical protein